MEGDKNSDKASGKSALIKKSKSASVASEPSTYKNFLAKKGYLVRQSLGSGSYSKVKLAIDFKDKEIDKFVAIKIVDTSKAPQDYQQKFMPRELELWPRLNHPHLVKLIETFRDESRVYMVEQYAPGGDMLHYIQKKGAMDESLARDWILQVMDAISYMHESGLAHRDLKLENLLITGQYNIQICDFGFAKPIGTHLSQTYCGSKSYAAPEILQGHPYDPMKGDVWALGVILYIMITGKMPYDESKKTNQLLDEMRNQNFRWFKYPNISELCKRFIHTMFEWYFKQRPYLCELMTHSWFTFPLKGKGLTGLREKAAQKELEKQACASRSMD